MHGSAKRSNGTGTIAISSELLFIGIPTFNRPAMALETIESVRASTLQDYRVVVSDNGSEKEAQDQVRRFVEGLGDPRFSFVVQPENGGEYGQGRYFFAQSQGTEFFTILHDDDLVDAGYLAMALDRLRSVPNAALLIANPRLIDEEGTISEGLTRDYLREHGRTDRSTGLFPILEPLLETGFTPISGTVFRRAALVASGFVDEDCTGNFPFELNVLLRLGDIGSYGWFETQTMLSVRFHHGSLRNTLGLMNNRDVVGTMLKLLQRRNYEGKAETRRRILLSRLHRAMAEIHFRDGDRAAAKREVATACRIRPQSANAWKTRIKLSMGAMAT